MREITWSVKGTLSVLLQSFSPTSIYRTGLKSWAFTAIFSNICTAHAQKRYLWTSGVNSHTAVRFADSEVQTFGDLATFSVDFCILYSECPPYFYFRFVWLTHLESIPHALTPTLRIPTKFEVDRTIHCRVTAFLSADSHVTWWPRPLTFWPWAVVIHGGSRDQPCHQVWRPYSFMSYDL